MNDFAAVLAAKSDQINALDLTGGDMTITITGVKVTPGTEQPVSISFEGSAKVWRPCKTTGRILMAAWGPDTAKYAGRSVQLYLDPKVRWGGLEVGGIRIRALSHMDDDLRVVVAESKAVRKPVTVKRLVMPERAAPAAPFVPALPTLDEARTIARKGKAAFSEWWAQNPDKRAAAKTILPELQTLCAEADAISADPFGLPPVPTDAEVSDQIAAEVAARDAQLEGGV